jgi:hypothetical protein
VKYYFGVMTMKKLVSLAIALSPLMLILILISPSGVAQGTKDLDNYSGIELVANAQSKSSSDWYDNAWNFRTPVEVSNPCGGEQDGYQVQISLDESFNFAHVQSDGSLVGFMGSQRREC